ncbi:MAG: tRNA lysidine(34) synthetase TilS [Verrucomicrobia bacterium]|nr:tRNA lysidine(34) synthetase TilS [Verrucomicrobiota bacterium]
MNPVDAIHSLCPGRKKFLVGVSGGADSVALLHLLRDAGCGKLVVCHLNHQLRGRESDKDENFVGKISARLSLPYLSSRVDVAAIARSEGLSIETAARNARHRFFAACAKSERCPRLILAHHAEDQSETLLWNLLRGSHGLKGMRAMQELEVDGRSLVLYRPLLEIRREQLRDYLHEHSITWREDASNVEPFAVRNRLRHEALPLLADIARRDVVPILNRQIESREETNELHDWIVATCKAFDPQGRIHVAALRKFPTAVQALVFRRYLVEQGVKEIGREVLQRCLVLLVDVKSFAVNLPGGRQLRRRAGRIFLQGAQ